MELLKILRLELRDGMDGNNGRRLESGGMSADVFDLRNGGCEGQRCESRGPGSGSIESLRSQRPNRQAGPRSAELLGGSSAGGPKAREEACRRPAVPPLPVLFELRVRLRE